MPLIDSHPWKGRRHDPERIAAAVRTWRTGTRSLRSISKEMGISPATICRYAQPAKQLRASSCSRCGQPITRRKMRPGQALYCSEVCRWGWTVSHGRPRCSVCRMTGHNRRTCHEVHDGT